MNCDCINTINKKLAEKNLHLAGYSYLMPSFKPIFKIACDWDDESKTPRGQRRRPPSMFVSHCPFCGTKVEIPKDETTTQGTKWP
jgi:hypothetical protein